MDEKKWLAERFEAHRPHLRAVAYRMLGSPTEADDAVQEAWLRLGRTDARTIENLGGWLTTVVARVCLDMLRARGTRREEPLGAHVPEPESGSPNGPEQERLLTDSVGLALLVMLDKLTPAERVAFVLHDLFDMPFDEVAPIVERTPAATRQLASRARRRMQGATEPADADVARHREVIEAFIAASRDGDFAALMTLLDPNVVYRADRFAVQMGSAAELRGARAVAEAFKGRATAARPALLDGALGLAVVLGGHLRLVLRLTLANDRISDIDVVADPERVREVDVAFLAGQ